MQVPDEECLNQNRPTVKLECKEFAEISTEFTK
jgi:hypothetical protein